MQTDPIDFYWRPNCGFCARLMGKIEELEIPVTMHNIWEDPDAAAVVRGVARGNETVPTVGINGHFLVNPSIEAVVETIRLTSTA